MSEQLTQLQTKLDELTGDLTAAKQRVTVLEIGFVDTKTALAAAQQKLADLLANPPATEDLSDALAKVQADIDAANGIATDAVTPRPAADAQPAS